MKDYRFSAKRKPIVFSFLLSCFMSLMVSGIATIQALGVNPDFILNWTKAWLFSWMIAFPMVTIVTPLVERILPILVKKA